MDQKKVVAQIMCFSMEEELVEISECSEVKLLVKDGQLCCFLL